MAPGSGNGPTAKGNGEHACGSNSSGSGKAPFRHIDDLVSVGVDIDPHTPLRKILELGDVHMKQAITFRDFGRPDLALQEYIKAFTIAVDKVPRHKDYPSMKSDRGDLNRLYNSLKMKITTHGAIFDKIKEDIKENNRLSGAQPTTSLTDSALPVSNRSSAQSKTSPQTVSNSNTAVGGDVKGSSIDGVNIGHKQKPAIHPKPEALHGKAIKSTSKVPAGDLADRFARLRESQASAQASKSVQLGQPAKSADLSVLCDNLSLVESSMSAMPKVPDAIYNPARGTVTSEVANLPSSAPRGMFSRANSFMSTPSASAWLSTENAIKAASREQFVTAQTYQTTQSDTAQNPVRIPGGDVITATSLARLLKQRVNVLLIDVRDRESFDEGHIKSPKTICVEPEILMRENISADEIADSMVLAPSNERLAIEQRDKVDLVVIYDQDSTYIPTRITGSSSEMVLYNARQALSYYSYSRPLKHSPKLLRGGLDSWTGEFGDHSLDVSHTAPGQISRDTASFRKTGRRFRSKTRTLTQDEIKSFEDSIKEDEKGIPAFDYIKTRDDFIRRFPNISGIPESMVTRALEDQEEEVLNDIAPAPPRRPAPAIPRTRYSGLESRDDDSSIGGLALASSGQPASIIKTGLFNPNNFCYINSTLQAFLATPGFIQEVLDPEWPRNWHTIWGQTPPVRPQLMAKILKNLWHWMDRKQFRGIAPSTFKKYLFSINTGANGGERESENKAPRDILKLGDHRQHDAAELLIFMFHQLAAETDVTEEHQFDELPAFPATTNDATREISTRYHETRIGQRAFNFIDRHFWHAQVYTSACVNCPRRSHVVESYRELVVNATGNTNLNTLLTRDLAPELVDGYKCESCNQMGLKRQRTILSFPPILVIHLPRAGNDRDNTFKVLDSIEFPMELNLEPWAVEQSTREEVASIVDPDGRDGILAETRYELYVIQVHNGPNLHSGHYWDFVKDGNPETPWIMVNDSHILPFNQAEWATQLRKLYKCNVNEPTPYLLWYKRKDIPFEWEKSRKARTSRN
ncbi:hypothetical protein M426DRAFT_6888 [Hypoxylon sp. CI-4A]|nr:hypothetical protein M426DRAFT_6888 [Hypoxylon sp. CI-4A]